MLVVVKTKLMTNLRNLNNKLTTNLGLISSKIALENSVNDQSLNILLENPLLEILNFIYNYKLVNANSIGKNFPGIDGIDFENKLMFQISSTFSSDKIKHTVDKVIKYKHYEKADELFFLFLGSKKRLNTTTKNEILKIIDNRFKFDFDKNIIDLPNLFQYLYTEQDKLKVLEVNKKIESVLFDIEINSNDSLEYIALTFDNEEIENAYVLFQIITKLGYNIVTTNTLLLEKAKERKSSFIDYIVVLKETSKLDFIKNIVVVVSQKYIQSNLDSTEPNCKIFGYLQENEIKPLLLNFTNYSYKISNKNYKNPRTVLQPNIGKIEKLVTDYLKPKPNLKYSFKDIENVLKSLFPIHSLNIFEEKDSFCLYNFTYDNSVINFLIFSHDYKRQAVLKKFDETYSKGYSTNLTVLLPKDYNQTTDMRLRTTQDKFPKNKVYFIDEYLYDKCLKNIRENVENRLLEEVFISPIFRLKDDDETLDDIINWLKNEETTVSFITGGGGDGKTTICEKIHDEILQNFDNHLVIFLNTETYIDFIQKRGNVESSKFTLQTIFEISNIQFGGVEVNTLKSNFAFGNITVIIDGIDEIISTLPNFSLLDFIEDLSQLEETLGKGKLIISCRDVYIEELVRSQNLLFQKHNYYKLLKFNKELAEQYFNKNFNNDRKKVADSLKLLNQFFEHFTEDEKEYIYSPFILEVISTIVDSDFDYDLLHHTYDSKLLVKNYSNDYLFYKIIDREIAKKEKNGFKLKVDEYVKLLSLLAIEKNGYFKLEDFDFLLKKINAPLMHKYIEESLKDNPFFSIKGERYIFRFDFYNHFFRINALYSKLIQPKSFDLTDSFLSMISTGLIYNSAIFVGLKNKIEKSELSWEQLLTCFKVLLDEINCLQNNSSLLINKAVSNLFVFINDLKNKNVTTRSVIIELFSDRNYSDKELFAIQNFHLLDIPELLNLQIDFSDFYFTYSVIDNYTMFLNCQFNVNTYFDNTCKISKVYNEKLDFRTSTATSKNFDNYITGLDNTLLKIVELIESGGEELAAYFRRYFRAFQKNNKLMEKISLNELPVLKIGTITLNEVNIILLNHSILSHIDKDSIQLNHDKKSKILKFINQNLLFKELSLSLREIENLQIKV